MNKKIEYFVTQKQAWEITKDEYANRVGTQKPILSLGLDISFYQASQMSQTALYRRYKQKMAEKKVLYEKYERAVEEWKHKVLEDYIAGKFNLNDAFELDLIADSTDTAFVYIIHEATKLLGKEVLSPFKTYILDKKNRGERIAYLNALDKKFRDVLKNSNYKNMGLLNKEV